MIDKPVTFYMVYAEGGESPRIRHPSRRSADTEAIRLAKVTANNCYVLKTVSMQYVEVEMKPTYVVKGISIGGDDDGLQ